MGNGEKNKPEWLFQRKTLPPLPFLAEKMLHGRKAKRKTL